MLCHFFHLLNKCCEHLLCSSRHYARHLVSMMEKTHTQHPCQTSVDHQNISPALASESCGEDNIKNINIYLSKLSQIMTCVFTYTGIHRSEFQQIQRPKCSHEEKKCVPGKKEGHFWQGQKKENEVGVDYLIY